MVGTAAILAEKIDVSPKLWTHKTSKEGLKAATLANSHPIDVKIWKPKLTADATTAALNAREKTVFPKEDRNTIIEKSKGNASLAATAAHAIPATETARVALPEAYAWGDRSKTISDAGLAASTFTHAKSNSTHNRSGSMASTSSFVSAASYAVFAKNGSLGDASGPDNSYMLNNIGNLEEVARKKANERLSKIYLPSSNTNIYAPKHSTPTAGGVAAAAAHLSAEEDAARVTREREEAAKMANQYESVMTLARERAENSISQIDQEVYYKNPLLNTQYYQEALAIAQEKGAARMENHGKIDIGGGVFMTQSEVDAIAERNVRPVLVEITEKADAQRQADEDRRIAEEEERKRVAEQKRIQQETKAEERRKASEQKAAHKAIQKEHLAQQKALQVTQRNAERERRDAERKVADEKKREEKAIADKKKAEERAITDEKKAEERARKAEERAKQKAAKQELVELRRKEKHALKLAAQATAAAAAAAKEAEALAAAEVKKTKALVAQADAKLEAAKLAEAQAATEEEAAKAKAETTNAKNELANAQSQAKDAESRQVEAKAETDKAGHEVHDVVAAQKDLERKYNQDVADIIKLDPSAAPKDNADELEEEEVSGEIKEILDAASAEVDAENLANKKLFKQKNTSDASFATAEDDSIYSSRVHAEKSEDKDKGKIERPKHQVIKSMLDVESVKSLEGSKGTFEKNPQSIPSFEDSPGSPEPESSAMAAARSIQKYPDSLKTKKPAFSFDSAPTSPTGPKESSERKLDTKLDHGPGEDADIEKSDTSLKISSPEHKPVEVVSLAPPKTVNLSDGKTESETAEPIKVVDPEDPSSSISYADSATVKTNASVISSPAPTPNSEVAKTGTSEAAAAATLKSVKKKSGSTGIFSRIKKAVGSSKSAGTFEPTSKEPSSTSSKPSVKKSADTEPTVIANEPVSDISKSPTTKPLDRTFSGFSENEKETEEEQDVRDAVKNHDSVNPETDISSAKPKPDSVLETEKLPVTESEKKTEVSPIVDRDSTPLTTDQAGNVGLAKIDGKDSADKSVEEEKLTTSGPLVSTALPDSNKKTTAAAEKQADESIPLKESKKEPLEEKTKDLEKSQDLIGTSVPVTDATDKDLSETKSKADELIDKSDEEEVGEYKPLFKEDVK